jgi:hypothetical protein
MSGKNLVRMLALVWLSGVLSCATVARNIGDSTTQGALEAIREDKEKFAQQEEEASRRTAGEITRGALEGLIYPEAPSPTDPGGGARASTGTGGSGLGPVPSLASQVARAFSAELERQLGPDGTGPLAQSLSATAGQVASSVVQQSRDELGTLFPECGGLQGEEARACRDEQLARLGSSFSRGAAEGMVQAFRPWLLLLTFGGGLIVGLLMFLAMSMARANRESSGGVGLFRQRRPA